MSRQHNLCCPNCQAVWGFDEIQFQQCDACGYPDNEEDWDEDEDDIDYAIENCHQDMDGYCHAAGSEYCEFECPFRKH